MSRQWSYSLFLVLFYFADILKADESMVPNRSGALPNFGAVLKRDMTMELCKGPKIRNCGKNSFKRDNDDIVEFTIQIFHKVEITKLKMAIYRNKNSSHGAKPDIVKWTKEPCSHFVVGPMLKDLYKIKSRCVIEKGVYTMKFNQTTAFGNLIGAQFFFGSFLLETSITSKDCNIFCFKHQFELDKQH